MHRGNAVGVSPRLEDAQPLRQVTQKPPLLLLPLLMLLLLLCSRRLRHLLLAATVAAAHAAAAGAVVRRAWWQLEAHIGLAARRQGSLHFRHHCSDGRRVLAGGYGGRGGAGGAIVGAGPVLIMVSLCVSVRKRVRGRAQQC